MAIGYSQEGYRPTTALANLTSQGIGPIDVTRGGGIQYAPLAQISIPSSQPELVAQGIASGIQSAASGVFSGIKANWEADQATKLAKAKGEYDIAKETAKELAKSKAQKEDPLYKAKLEHYQKSTENIQSQIEKRNKAVLPSGFFGSDSSVEPELPEESPDEMDRSGLPEVDPETGKDLTSVDLTAIPDAIEGAPSVTQSTPEKYTRDVVPKDKQTEIAQNVASQVGALSELTPAELGVGTGAIPIPEQKPSFSLAGIETTFEPAGKGKEVAETRLGLRKAISEAEKPVQNVLQPKTYPVKSFAELNKLESMPLAENVKSASLIRNPKTGEYAYHVVGMTPSEIAEEQRKKAETESKIKSRQQYEGQKQERLYQQYITAAQNEPSVKTLEDPKFGMAKFTAEIPEFYQQYKDYLAESEKAKQKGDKQGEIYNRRMVSETVNAIIDSFARLASGKAVTEGQLTMIKKESIDPLQQFSRMTDSWLKGGVVAPDEQVRSIAKIATSMGNEAAEKANYFILGQREKFKEQGVPEKNLPKFYPQDIGFENEAKRTLASLLDDHDVKSEQYDAIKDSKDPKDQYKIDVLKKQLELLDYRIDSLNERIEANELMSKKGKRKQILGHKEFVDRPTGLRDMYGISPFQQMMQQMSQPAAE